MEMKRNVQSHYIKPMQIEKIRTIRDDRCVNTKQCRANQYVRRKAETIYRTKETVQDAGDAWHK